MIIPALEIDRLTVRFGGLTALDQVSFRVNAGEIYAVIGPNGAGKTSLFNAITGIHPASSGRVLIAGSSLTRRFTPATAFAMLGVAILSGLAATIAINANDAWDQAINAQLGAASFPWAVAWSKLLSAFAPAPVTLVPLAIGTLLGALGAWSMWWGSRRTPELVAHADVARTFQNIRLFRDMSVRDNLLVGLDRRLRTRLWEIAFRLPRCRTELAQACRMAEEILDVVGLRAQSEMNAGSLPYGHQRRLEIARALASRPSLLLLDEPAAGLNPSESAELMELIRAIRSRGITVLLIEHDMRVVMGISDRICVLHYGSRIAEGTPADIRAHPVVIAAYLGKDDHG